MVVPSVASRYWTIVVSLVTVCSLYVTLVNLTIDEGGRSYGSPVKKIVAYSLLKQIERDSEEVDCGGLTTEVKAEKGAGTGWRRVGGSRVFVYSVHKDTRLDPFHFVRIIGMVKGSLNTSLFCQLNSEDTLTYVTKATTTDIWSDEWDKDSKHVYFNPILVSCRIPFGLQPKSLRLSTNPCEVDAYTHVFDLNEPQGIRRQFTVCVKPLNFNADVAKKLVQWMEMLKILGADKIDLYIGTVTDKVRKILRRYVNSSPQETVTRQFGEITQEQINSPPTDEAEEFERRIWQKRRYELIVYNDCLYRNLRSRFVVPLDVDEIIVPLKARTWHQVLDMAFATHEGLERGFASFCVANAYYFRETNERDVVYFADVNRSEVSRYGESCKSFVATEKTLTVFNHYALEALKPGVSRAYFLPSDLVQMNHYKVNCSTVILPECTKYYSSPRVKDMSIFKYKHEFYKKYKQIIKHIGNIL